MTAALDMAAFPPEVLDALAERLAAKLKLVPSPLSTLEEDAARGLSMLLKSIRRRACERRQADAVRGDRIGDRIEGLSTIPASVRRRECEQRRLAAKKADSIASRMYLHGEAYEKHTGVVPNGDARGPLAEGVAAIVDRAEGRKKLELRRLYSEIRKALFEGSKGRIRLPTMWASLKTEKEDARTLLAEYALGQIRGAALSLGETWKPSKEFPRPTVSLVLWRLQVWRAGSRPAKRADSRRLTGEQLEDRHRDRASAAAPAQKSNVVSPEKYSLDRADPPYAGTDTRTVPTPGTSETASDVSEVGRNPGEALSPVNAPEQAPRGSNTALSSAGPLQLAEPSATSSAEAQAVLELVNATAARCRAFRGRP